MNALKGSSDVVRWLRNLNSSPSARRTSHSGIQAPGKRACSSQKGRHGHFVMWRRWLLLPSAVVVCALPFSQNSHWGVCVSGRQDLAMCFCANSVVASWLHNVSYLLLQSIPIVFIPRPYPRVGEQSKSLMRTYFQESWLSLGQQKSWDLSHPPQLDQSGVTFFGAGLLARCEPLEGCGTVSIIWCSFNAKFRQRTGS